MSGNAVNNHAAERLRERITLARTLGSHSGFDAPHANVLADLPSAKRVIRPSTGSITERFWLPASLHTLPPVLSVAEACRMPKLEALLAKALSE